MDEQNTQPVQQTGDNTDAATVTPVMEADQAPVEIQNGHGPYAAPPPEPAPTAEPEPAGTAEPEPVVAAEPEPVRTAENDMAALLAASDEQFRQLKYGDVIEGTIM